MKTIGELAKSLDLNTKQLSEKLSYSRTELYMVLNNYYRPGTMDRVKFSRAMNKLKQLSAGYHSLMLERVERETKKREEFIAFFIESFEKKRGEHK